MLDNLQGKNSGQEEFEDTKRGNQNPQIKEQTNLVVVRKSL